MSFVDAIKICFSKYADFKGRAKLPEFWWFALFCFVAALLLEFVSPYVSGIFSLATMVPSFAVGARRLHDTNKSGWWQLLWLIPILGWLALLYFFIVQGDESDNRFNTPAAN
jgi:uncharacterized membrane protein YhaH (DUF805 family)